MGDWGEEDSEAQGSTKLPLKVFPQTPSWNDQHDAVSVLGTCFLEWRREATMMGERRVYSSAENFNLTFCMYTPGGTALDGPCWCLSFHYVSVFFSFVCLFVVHTTTDEWEWGFISVPSRL